VVSAVGTVGLSTGITGPELAPGLKLLLCVDMLMGRLEIVAVLVLLYPPTWIARQAEAG
jgi:trk system potassium uptake protein TrkH